ncbi:MAG: cyclopropane-fatty-acyl-phospholipid synthase family protein [Alphaproteobacteria bacterium]
MDFSLIFRPSLRVPEAIMNGDLIIEDGTLYDFLDLASRNFHHLEAQPLARLLSWLDPARLGQRNPARQARRNVAHHYDLSGELYNLFLDRDLEYSCAYFPDDERDLEQAQHAKKRHIASKLLLKPGQKVLDIGCGWGGLALYLASIADVEVTGITLSVEQVEVARRRAAEAGLADRVSFRLRDYRDETATYDRIVSVGMFEHVGRQGQVEFFDTVRYLLNDDGVMLLHSIGRFDGPAPINPFIRKYIFPGSDLPALSEVMGAVEPTGLFTTDIELLRLHYAETLRLWRERFTKQRDKAAEIYDARFVRMWELYLIICELGFRHQNLMVFQMQLSKQLDGVPLTRDYMLDWERRQAKDETKRDQRAA